MPTITWKSLIAALCAGAAIIAGLYHADLSNNATTPSSIDIWLKSERPIVLRSILNNIGPSGSKAVGARPGIVVASPSTSDPDYFYARTRDSALTVETLVHEFIATKSPELEKTIEDYISAQAVLQRVDNPSGGLRTGGLDGLGEPKFNINLTAFTGDWGRPQRDGPALRAIALISYARHLMSKGQNDTVLTNIWPILR